MQKHFALSPAVHLFPGRWLDLTLMSFLQIGADGSVNVSHLPARPHVTAGCGGFIDITSHAKRIIFSGFFNAGAQLQLEEGQLRIIKEGKAKNWYRTSPT